MPERPFDAPPPPLCGFPCEDNLVPSTLFRCSERTEGSLGSESSKVLLKHAHWQICLAVSTDLEEAETTRCPGTRRSRGAVQRRRHERGIMGLTAALLEPSLSHCDRKGLQLMITKLITASLLSFFFFFFAPRARHPAARDPG